MVTFIRGCIIFCVGMLIFYIFGFFLDEDSSDLHTAIIGLIILAVCTIAFTLIRLIL